jgi:hypothetical protein
MKTLHYNADNLLKEEKEEAKEHKSDVIWLWNKKKT